MLRAQMYVVRMVVLSFPALHVFSALRMANVSFSLQLSACVDFSQWFSPFPYSSSFWQCLKRQQLISTSTRIK